MHVIITCKYEKDRMQNRRHQFIRCSRAGNSMAGARIWPNIKLLRAHMHVIVSCRYEKDRLRKSDNIVFRIITLWELSVAMETRVLI